VMGYCKESYMIELRAVYKIRTLTPWPCLPVTFNCSAGQHLRLVGPNGCGKTTLLEIIAGKLTHEGERLYSGRTILYIPALFQLSPLGRVSEYLLRFKYLYLSRGCVNKVADYWGLTESLGTDVSRLSRGQQQRLILCQLSFSDSDLWILDEPYLGLDDSGIESLDEIMRGHLIKKGSVIEAGQQWVHSWQPNLIIKVPYREKNDI
jgi:ABC-type transport system involved in cytochrome c biogenesis ATPase subunit